MNDVDPDYFPIGEVVEQAASSNEASNPFRPVRAFAQEVVGQLVFIGAHESGHIRNGHRTAANVSCERFAQQERQADAFAAGALAGFQFNMGDGSGNQPLNDWKAFFTYYKDSSFGLEDRMTPCTYQTPEARTQWVERAYQVAWDELMQVTYSSPDIAASEPTSAICTDGVKT